ncbi:structural maintenance of chromosomes protein 2-like isoform X2 [Gouania willdenowi]|uniref:structural maintenance of chromosomes protein 2-like isoform X2 n=1 Tax=Gouania willdenowi TaxID=441366 RepID=UPI001054DD8E|nr:structural maintenance of chromosomes protein 2-like isoform X2 [Gouania willdenowi]
MSDMENENNAVNQSVITGTDIEHFVNEKLRDLLQSSEARHKEKDAEIEKMKAQLAFYKKKVQVFVDDLLNFSKMNRNHCDEANMKIQTLTEEKHKFMKLNQVHQRKMEWEKDQLFSTKTELEKMELEQKTLQKHCQSQNDQITDYKEQNHNLRKQNNSLQENLKRLCEIEEMFQNTQTEKAILKLEIDDVQRQVVNQNDQITDYKEQNHNLRKQNNSLQKHIKRLCEIEEMFQNTQTEKAILKLENDKVQRKVVNQNDKITDYKEQNHNLIQQNNSLQKDIKRLCEIEEMFQNTQTEKAILKLENDKVSIKVKYLCDNLVMTEQENNDLKRKLTEAIHINLILKNTITKMKHENDKLKRNVVKCSEKPVSVTTSLTEAHVGSESTPIASSEDSDSQSSKQENHKTSKFKKMKNFLKKKLLRKKDS